MARKDKTPSYVLELEMKTTAYDRKVLGKKYVLGKISTILALEKL